MGGWREKQPNFELWQNDKQCLESKLQRARLWSGGTITPSPGFAVRRECQVLQTVASTPLLLKVKPAQPASNNVQSSVQGLGLVWSPGLGCKGAHLWEQREGQREAVKTGKSGPASVWLTDWTPHVIGKKNQEPWISWAPALSSSCTRCAILGKWPTFSEAQYYCLKLKRVRQEGL